MLFEAGEGGLEDFGELGFFGGGEATEDEVNIADFLTKIGIISAEAEAWEIGRFEMG